MAQARVTEFFNSRKRTGDIHPSKRRKVQRLAEFDQQTEEVAAVFTSPPISARTRRKAVPTVNINLNTPGHNNRAKTKVAASKSTTKKATRKGKSVAVDETSIRDIFIKGIGEVHAPIINSQDSTSKHIGIIEETTAACDDHTASPPSTPTKRSSKADASCSTVSKKRSKSSKPVRKDLFQDLQKTPEGTYDFKPYAQTSEQENSVESIDRKKLVSKRKDSPPDGKASPVFTFGDQNKDAAVTDSKGSKSNPRQRLVLKASSNKAEAPPVEKNVTTIGKDKSVVVTVSETSSQPETTQANSEQSNNENKNNNTEKSEKVKQKALTPAEVRSKLAKCGKLEELKEQLAAFNKASAKVKQSKQSSKVKAKDGSKGVPKVADSGEPKVLETQSTAKAPAYQRFHSLAIPVPPTLSLPFKYKILAEMFSSMDTVVSILTKRHEICTFSKLKSAVQNMMRKAFETPNIGQIKTVYPEAYNFRQEKGLQMFGGKTSGYQLTVEANLQHDENEKNTKEKANYTASKILERKDLFHRGLIDVVKDHHKEFLRKLERPLSISDDKITRWHPKFPLDQVPDIEPAPLPEPPDFKKLSTASEVLAEARGKIVSPRIQRALETVAKRSEANSKTASSPAKSDVGSKTSTPDTPNTGLKGVPQSLLERIRAKEAQKLESEMTRTPENSRRLEMISRLPELVRILRSFFVTQKKPALLMTDAVQKLSDSYRTKMGPVEAEHHLKLMIELLPEYITVISVKKGIFLKLDKNRDIGVIRDKLDRIKKEQT